MPTHTRVAPVLFIAALLATAGFGAALAQDSGSTTEEQPQEGSNENSQAAEGAEGEVGVQRRANLSGPEQIAQAQEIVSRGASLRTHISNMLDEARRDRDIVRITCLNDKLTQTNATLSNAADRVGALENAVADDNTDSRNHEYTVMTVLGQHFRVLEQEANQCVGQEIFDTGVTRVETSVSSDAPAEEDPGSVTEPPPIAIPIVPPPESGTM